MHELSIATGIVEMAAKSPNDANEDRPVESIRVRIGSLAGVVIEALDFAWSVASEETRCHGARLEIEHVPAKVLCSHCGHETELSEPIRFTCAHCGESAADVIAGHELDVVSLELKETKTEPIPGSQPSMQESAHASTHP